MIFLFSLSCLVYACDMNVPTRDVNTLFKQVISNTHPSGVPFADIVCMSADERRKHRGELQHAIQRHKCCNYCLRDNVCSFGFPLPLVEKTHVIIEVNCVEKQLREIPENQEEYTANLGPTHSYELYYKIDCVNKRNDRWMNTHVETFLDSWMANIDFQVVIDLVKVVSYLIKYVTKSESDMSKGMLYVINGVLTWTLY